MSRDIDELINGYLDESLSEEESPELADWIKADPAHARQFARATMLHDRLQSELNAGIEGDEADDDAEAGNVVAFPGASVGRWLIPLAAMIVLLMTLLLREAPPQKRASEAPPEIGGFATLAHSVDAHFAESKALTIGQRLEAGAIQLAAGLIRIQFDSGVEVTLQGPAHYELLKTNLTRLNSGLLTANVPPGAEGFRVDTPTAEVTDLGTSFGVHLDEDGASHVSVFDGEVEVAEPDSGEKKRLKEGEQAVVTSDRKLESAEFDAKPYGRIWPISFGVVESTGSFELAPPWPRRPALINSDKHIYLFSDGYRRRLRHPLLVNISEPGEVVLRDKLTPKVITVGQIVRSFIVQHQPESSMPRPEAKRARGSITFDRPILGLITQLEELRASSGRFSKRKVRGQPRTQLEFTGTPAGDRVTLSADRRTLTVDLAAPNGSTDVLRVIIDARPP